MSEELVERLRKSADAHDKARMKESENDPLRLAADAIERLTKERDQAQFHLKACSEVSDYNGRKAYAAEARIKVLEQALRPFAELADEIPADTSWDDHVRLEHAIGGDEVSVGMIRAARAALTASHSQAQPPAPPPEK